MTTLADLRALDLVGPWRALTSDGTAVALDPGVIKALVAVAEAAEALRSYQTQDDIGDWETTDPMWDTLDEALDALKAVLDA